MSGGLPDEKPWASCCPRSEATTTFTLIPLFLDHEEVATLTAFVSAGPELPIKAVISPALACDGEPVAVVAATADAPTVTTASASAACRRAIRVFRCVFTRSPLLEASRTTKKPVAALAGPAPPDNFVCGCSLLPFLRGRGRTRDRHARRQPRHVPELPCFVHHAPARVDKYSSLAAQG